ncbi:MAG: YggS family pyridoxal phosphate-dependent enzyme [Polymorphobacter sp.]
MEMTDTAAAGRLAAVREGVARGARAARRDPASVTLIAVSKTHTAAAIQPLIAAGQCDFGENRVTEAAEKWPGLRAEAPGVRLHLIGQLQSNKAPAAVALFDVIHSIDRLSLVAALAQAAQAAGRAPDCFIQVNIGAEPQKGGCNLDELDGLVAAVRASGLPLVGLMCIPPVDIEAAPFFALLAKLGRDHGLPALSMGMSSDYETAVMLGATHVRVGSALFGARD